MTNDTEDFDYGESLSKEGSGFGVSGAESLPDRQTNEKPTTDPVWGSSNVDSYAEDDLGSGPEPQPQEEYIDAEFEDASDDQDGYLGGRLSRRQALAGAAGAGLLSLGGVGALLAGSSEEDEDDETRDEQYQDSEDCQKTVRFGGSELEEAGETYEGPEEGFFQMHQNYGENDEGVVYQTEEGWQYEDGDFANHDIIDEIGEHIYDSLNGSCE